METLRLPELSDEQLEHLCLIAEAAARKYMLSKASEKDYVHLDVSVEAEGAKQLALSVEIEAVLTPRVSLSEESLRIIVKDAVKEAFKASEEYLRKLT
jgi:hypothetical protein